MNNDKLYIPDNLNEIFASNKTIADLLIDKSFILSRISQEEVFEFLLQQTISLRGKIVNTLRGESTPSVSFIYTMNDKLLGTDWGDSTYKGDCFTWANMYYHKQKKSLQDTVDFYNTSPTSPQYLKAKDTLDKLKGKSIYELLAADLGIKGKPILDRDSYLNQERKNYKIVTTIDLDSYLEDDLPYYPPYVLNYLNMFYQHKSSAVRFGVLACKKVIFRKIFFDLDSKKATVSVSEVFKETESDFILAYYFAAGKYKIYRPYGDTKYKWRTNHSIVDDFGMQSCNSSVLTKSRKDRMVLSTLGDESYGFSSESELSIDKIKENTDYILYDNDYTKSDDKNAGLVAALRIQELYNKAVKDKTIHNYSNRKELKLMFIPSIYECTDIAEIINKYGAYKARQIYKDIKNNALK